MEEAEERGKGKKKWGCVRRTKTMGKTKGIGIKRRIGSSLNFTIILYNYTDQKEK